MSPSSSTSSLTRLKLSLNRRGSSTIRTATNRRLLWQPPCTACHNVSNSRRRPGCRPADGRGVENGVRGEMVHDPQFPAGTVSADGHWTWNGSTWERRWSAPNPPPGRPQQASRRLGITPPRQGQGTAQPQGGPQPIQDGQQPHHGYDPPPHHGGPPLPPCGPPSPTPRLRSPPPPGWYSDGSGEGLRWWNGREWTEHRNGPAPTQPVPASVWEGIRPPITPPSYWSARFPNGVTAGDILALIVIAVVLFLVIYYMFLP
jgi:hypothetical protein